ncbi:MAG: fatty acid desaturase [Bacteriovoracaceae bacterium]|nr:fatty acid desaturase [Bacteriovoracaceae bacterium]
MLFNKLRQNPTYFFQCVIGKKFILISIYILSLYQFGYGENILLFSLLSFFLVSPNPRVQLIVFLACMIAVIYLHQTSLAVICGLFLFGTYWGGLMSILIHNASHEIFKSSLLNRIFGEVSSFFLTIGFINFLYIHLQHHIHSDKEDDPHHNMEGLGFLDYWASMGKNVTKVFKTYLPTKVCKSKGQYKYLVTSVVLNKLLLIHIQLIWFGEEGFTLFSVPCIIGSQVLFAYINYYTHPNIDQMRDKVIDLNLSFTDKVINRLFFGVLFHQTHHKYPKVPNPMKHQIQKNVSNCSVELSPL